MGLIYHCVRSSSHETSHGHRGVDTLKQSLSIPRLHGALRDETEYVMDILRQNHVVNASENSLPDLSPSRGLDHLSSSGSCPWRYVITRDDNRIPSTLIESRCINSNCQGVDRNSDDGCRAACHCQEVYRFVKIKRKRVSTSRIAMFSEVWERLAVGCTCTCDFSTSWNQTKFSLENFKIVWSYPKWPNYPNLDNFHSWREFMCSVY